MDFIEEYIKKNEELNGSKYTNIDFRCGDATQIQFNDGEFDVVFSNWLLMYLTDTEVQALAINMLRLDALLLASLSACYILDG